MWQRAKRRRARPSQDYYEERYRERVLRNLAQRANKMGMRLVTAEPAA